LNANFEIRIAFKLIEDLLARLKEGTCLHASHLTAGSPVIGLGLVCTRIHLNYSVVTSEDGLYSLKDGQDNWRRIVKGNKLMKSMLLYLLNDGDACLLVGLQLGFGTSNHNIIIKINVLMVMN
jgi:hypothetical protein